MMQNVRNMCENGMSFTIPQNSEVFNWENPNFSPFIIDECIA